MRSAARSDSSVAQIEKYPSGYPCIRNYLNIATDEYSYGTLEDYRTFLSSEAHRLSSRFEGSFVPVGKLSYELGAQISREKIGPFACYITFPVRANSWANIILPIRYASSPSIASYERFCVAHELAHLVLYRHSRISARRESEYWKHEVLCDEFARSLLMPIRMLKLQSYEDMLAAIDRLSLGARVPVMHAARRLAQVGIIRNAVFKVAVQSDKMIIISSSQEDRRNQGRHLKGLLALRLKRLFSGNENETAFTIGWEQFESTGIRGIARSELINIKVKKRVYTKTAIISIEAIGEDRSLLVKNDQEGRLFRADANCNLDQQLLPMDDCPQAKPCDRSFTLVTSP